MGGQTKRSTKHRKSNPVLTKENTPVINAIRDAVDAKVWICNDDSLEINRKPLKGFVATPGEGVTDNEHIQLLKSAILALLEETRSEEIVKEESDAIIDAIFDIKEKDFGYPNMTDLEMWRGIFNFVMPDEFLRRLAKQYDIKQKTADIWIMDYLKYVYIKALRPSSVPSENIGKVQRLHLQYTKSYGDLCGILENNIPYVPIDRVNGPEQHTEYTRTKQRYNTEFSEAPNPISWNGTESIVVEQSVDTNRFFVIKKFWKR